MGYQHSGFSVEAGVCIEAHDRAALERLLRYCVRPPFSMDRLRKEGTELVYRCAKQSSEPGSDKRGAKVDELHLTPLELIDRIAALGSTTAYPQAPLLWSAGTEFATALCGNGAGPGRTGATDQASRGAVQAGPHGRGRAGSGTAGPCEPTRS